MSSQDLVYIDVQVFAYRLIPNPTYGQKLFEQSRKFFEDISHGVFQGITSTFTETEYRGVVKRVLSNVRNHQITPLEEQVAMDEFNGFLSQLGIVNAAFERVFVQHAD